MNKQILLRLLVDRGTLGCFGADPDMNSQCLPAVTLARRRRARPARAAPARAARAAAATRTAPSSDRRWRLSTAGSRGSCSKRIDEPREPERRPARRCTPTLTFDSAVGSPNPGSLKVVAPYSGANQYVDIQKSFGDGSPQDWTGKTLHVRIRASEGTFTGGAQVYAITDRQLHVRRQVHQLHATNNNWQEFTVNLDSPMTPNAGYDPSKVIVFGVQLNTGARARGATGDVQHRQLLDRSADRRRRHGGHAAAAARAAAAAPAARRARAGHAGDASAGN